jgi:CSLREA domain-containing protein
MRNWLTWSRRRSRPVARRHPRVVLCIERLEDRLAPATITVTTTADDIIPNDGSVSLREAITAINAGNNLGDPDIIAQNPGTFGTNDTIKFNIPGTGPFVILVGTNPSALNIPLPAITNPVVIDGTSQPGFTTTPIVVLSGASAGANANGLDIELGFSTASAGATVQGLVINQFTGNGIQIGADNISGSGAVDNTITGNFIGTDASGNSSAATGNHLNGVFINGVDSNNLGTEAGNNRINDNVISGNGNDGVLIQANANGIATGNIVSGNFIGTNLAGTANLHNGVNGIEILSASGNTVGGTAAAALTATTGAGNVVSGNAANGIQLAGTLTDGGTLNLVEGNFIGVDSSGNKPLGNVGSGIVVSGQTADTIGGDAKGAGNVVGGNAEGIELDNGAQNNIVRGNSVGIGADGASNVGNTRHGIVMHSNGAAGQPNEPPVLNNLIGGVGTGDGNTVAFNGSAGVAVFGNPVSLSGQANVGNTIEGNSIFLNGRTSPGTLIGIDLSTKFPFPMDDGVTPNDSQGHGAANDPNNFQDFPVISSVTVANGSTTVTGTLTQAVSPNTTFRIEFFSNNPDPVGIAEGQTFLGSTSVTTDATGSASFSTTLTVALASPQNVTATATDPLGNTSEFSAAVLVPLPPPVTTTVTITNITQTYKLLSQVETVTAQVTSGGQPVTSGQVTFTDHGQSKTVNVDASGTATAKFTFKLLLFQEIPQAHPVTATFNGITATKTAPDTTLGFLFQLFFDLALFQSFTQSSMASSTTSASTSSDSDSSD